LPNLLKNLHLEELSLVDRPANAQAMVSLFKRDTSEEEITKMTDEMEAKVKAYMEDKACGKEDAMKALGYNMDKADDSADDADLEALKADVETLKAEKALLSEENERLRKGLIDNGYIINADAIEKKAEVEMLEVSGEMVVKSDIPAPVLKALEEAAVEKADVELTKRAGEALPHFDISVAKALVAKFSDEEIIMEALRAADAAFDAAMQEFGKSDVDGEFATSADKLDALVKSYMDDNQLKKSEYAKAYAAVAKTDEGKSLINKSYKDKE
jgi:hypothetical protein